MRLSQVVIVCLVFYRSDWPPWPDYKIFGALVIVLRIYRKIIFQRKYLKYHFDMILLKDQCQWKLFKRIIINRKKKNQLASQSVKSNYNILVSKLFLIFYHWYVWLYTPRNSLAIYIETKSISIYQVKNKTTYQPLREYNKWLRSQPHLHLNIAEH